MSDAVIQTIVTGVCGLVGTVALGVLAYLTAKLKTAVQSAGETTTQAVQQGTKTNAVVTAAVNTTLVKTAEKITGAVNGPMTAQLRLNAVLSRRIAVLTGLAEDRAVADAAEQLYRDHVG